MTTPSPAPRIAPLTSAPDGSNAAKVLQSRVGHMTIFRLLAHAEGNAIPVMKLGGSILADQQLDARSRELAVLVALAMDEGRYEWPQHVEIALNVGVTAVQIECLAHGDYITAFDARDRALLAFAAMLVRQPRVDEETYASLRAHFSEREIVETILAVGFYMMLARLTEALDVDEEPAEGMAVVRSLKSTQPSD